MKRLAKMRALLAVLALLAVSAAASAAAEFGLKDLDVAFENQNGEPETQAGAHPDTSNNSL